MLFAFQASERCNGMILSAYMLKPVQRIPSYRLLLIGELFVLRDKGVLAYQGSGSHRQLVMYYITTFSMECLFYCLNGCYFQCTVPKVVGVGLG